MPMAEPEGPEAPLDAAGETHAALYALREAEEWLVPEHLDLPDHALLLTAEERAAAVAAARAGEPQPVDLRLLVAERRAAREAAAPEPPDAAPAGDAAPAKSIGPVGPTEAEAPAPAPPPAASPKTIGPIAGEEPRRGSSGRRPISERLRQEARPSRTGRAVTALGAGLLLLFVGAQAGVRLHASSVRSAEREAVARLRPDPPALEADAGEPLLAMGLEPDVLRQAGLDWSSRAGVLARRLDGLDAGLEAVLASDGLAVDFGHADLPLLLAPEDFERRVPPVEQVPAPLRELLCLLHLVDARLERALADGDAAGAWRQLHDLARLVDLVDAPRVACWRHRARWSHKVADRTAELVSLVPPPGDEADAVAEVLGAAEWRPALARALRGDVAAGLTPLYDAIATGDPEDLAPFARHAPNVVAAQVEAASASGLLQLLRASRDRAAGRALCEQAIAAAAGEADLREALAALTAPPAVEPGWLAATLARDLRGLLLEELELRAHLRLARQALGVAGAEALPASLPELLEDPFAPGETLAWRRRSERFGYLFSRGEDGVAETDDDLVLEVHAPQ